MLSFSNQSQLLTTWISAIVHTWSKRLSDEDKSQTDFGCNYEKCQVEIASSEAKERRFLISSYRYVEDVILKRWLPVSI